MRTASLAAALAAFAFAGPAVAAPVLMSADWAKDACAAWNRDPVLTDKLVESEWVKNDKGRGFKVMQVYRSDCGDKPTAEMRIALKDGKAAWILARAPDPQMDAAGFHLQQMVEKSLKALEHNKVIYIPYFKNKAIVALSQMGLIEVLTNVLASFFKHSPSKG